MHSVLQSCDDDDNVSHAEQHGFTFYMPEGVRRISTDLYVVCEASFESAWAAIDLWLLQSASLMVWI